jgi:prophage antirepressor-like protein
MTDTIIDVYDNILKFKGNEIMVIFDDESMSWFSGVQVATIMGYEYPTDAVKNNVSQKN